MDGCQIDTIPMINDPLFYALAVPAVLLTGISKGGFAGGIGLVAVPMMALAISPVQAAGILLPILMVMDTIGLWAYRRSFDKSILLALIPGAFIGIAIGALLAGIVSDAHVKLIVGLISIGFVADRWLRSGPAGPPKPVNRIKGSLWGSVAGFTSFVAHAGAPPYQVFVLPLGRDKTIYVGTSIIFFAVINWIKLPPYFALGLLAPTNLWASLILLPLAPIGMGLGIWLHKVIPEKPFFRVVYVLIFVIGLKLVWDGIVAFGTA